MRTAALIIIGMLLLSAAAAFADTSAVSSAPTAGGHFEPAGLERSVFEDFISAVTANGEWTVTDEQAGSPHPMTAEERFIWAGSEIKAQIDLGKPIVTFARKATDLLPANSFTLEIGFERSRMVLLSSAPGQSRMINGVALPYSGKKSFRRFIAGSGDTGFVVLIPKQSNPDWYGLAVCPRNRIDEKTTHTLLATGYSAESVTVPVQGELSAKQRTGISKGSIEGEVLTSANIPRAVPSFRDVTAENPLLGIQYFADSSDSAAAEVKIPYAGVVMRGALTAPQGAKRSKRIEAFVRAIPFTPVKPIEYTQDGFHYLIDAGECYAIIRGVLFEENFAER